MGITSYCIYDWQAIKYGVVEKTTKDRQKNGILGATTPISEKSILSSTISLAPSNVMSLLKDFLLGLDQGCTLKTLQ